MEQLIPIINKLNDVLTATGDWRLRSPTIVAIGMQSSGKSSVLENIVGRDFLPRGTGLVTRCPLELQLINVPRATGADGLPASGEPNEWGEFAHIDGRKRFYNFDEIRQEVVRQTERLAGKNRGIVQHPIGLTIYSYRVPDLLIVDLPGMVKTPQGDQPADIERQIRDIWMSYIMKPDCIILAVSAATQDIVACDALKTALEVDPEGDRTIGVLTKVDLMDAGTDAREILAGRIIYLKRGFVPLVARSQKDISDLLPIEKSLTREQLFFERHPAYRAISARCGTQYLVRVLSHLLLSAIKVWLPKVRTEVSLMLQYSEQQLRDLGPSVESIDMGEAGQTVLKLLSRYATNYCDMLEGRLHADASDDMLTEMLFGGARIQEHIRSRFFKAVEDWMRSFVHNAHTTLPSAEILMALRNSSGPRPTLFIPEQAFIALARRCVKTLKEQGRRFVQYVYDELRRVSDQCQPPELRRFGDLRERAIEVVHDLLKRSYTPTLAQVDSMIDFELSHVNTLHPDFVGADGAMRAVRANADRELFYREGTPFDPCYESEDEAVPDDEGEDDGFEEDDPVSEAGHISLEGVRAVPPDVEWAVQQLGGVLPDSDVPAKQKQRRRGRSKSPSHHEEDAVGAATAAAVYDYTHATAGPTSVQDRIHASGTPVKSRSRLAATRQVDEAAGSEAASSTSRQTNDSIRDVTERFQQHIVADIAGHGPDDPLPVGAVRVGGKHSPFVAQPVVRNGGTFPGSGSTYAGMSGSSVIGASPAKRNPLGGMMASPIAPSAALKTPGYGLASSGERQVGASSSSDYVHYSVTQLPSRPLPAVITPADLRPTPKEKLEIRVIRYLLFSYLQIVKKTYQDMVPKVVMSMLVNKTRDDISSDLVHKLYSVISGPGVLLRETDDIAASRRTLNEQLRLLRRAMDVLGEVRDAASLPRDLPGPTMSPPASLSEPALHQSSTAGVGVASGRQSPVQSTRLGPRVPDVTHSVDFAAYSYDARSDPVPATVVQRSAGYERPDSLLGHTSAAAQYPAAAAPFPYFPLPGAAPPGMMPANINGQYMMMMPPYGFPYPGAPGQAGGQPMPYYQMPFMMPPHLPGSSAEPSSAGPVVDTTHGTAVRQQESPNSVISAVTSTPLSMDARTVAQGAADAQRAIEEEKS